MPPTTGLHAITTYFNPLGYARRRQNYDQFRHHLDRQQVPLLTMELAFGDRPYELDVVDDRVIRLRTRDIMWQKERLLNLALHELPTNCEKVAWIDCDLLFDNDSWAADCARLLDSYPLVQPYESATQHGMTVHSIPAVRAKGIGNVMVAKGLAWSGRRELLMTHGFYDVAILGGADGLMTAAMFGETPFVGHAKFDSPRAVPMNPHQREHYERWSQPFFADVRGEVYFAPGSVQHLEHGSLSNRRFWERASFLCECGYNPHTDIALGEDGCWQWVNPNPALPEFAKRYFEMRQEDSD